MKARAAKQQNNPFIKSGLLKKLLLFVVATLMMNALLVAAVFTYTSRNVFANMKAEELVPKANFISRMVGQYQRGEVSQHALETTLMSDTSLWDATVHVFGALGEVIARPLIPESEQIQEHLKQFLPDILQGETGRIVTTSPELGIVVGVPVYGIDASVIGAVFLTKPLNEVNAALSGLNTALIISSLLVLLVILLPAYIGSRGFTMPLRQMSQAALAMATGNFSVRADDTRKDETGELGRSLNELSQTLSQMIGDLMLERNRLRNVLDGLREGVMAVDAKGEVTHCNPAAYRLLGCVGEDPARAKERLRTLFANADETLMGIGEDTAAYGEAQLRVMVTGLVSEDGRRYGAVAMIQDVTEEVRLEQTRRDYVANVGHELRTPIASIRGLSEALSDGMVKKEEDKQRYYGYILRESMRLSRLIDDLLELSRLQSGGVALERNVFALRPLLMELTERFEALAKDSGLSFKLSLPDEKLLAYSNADRVEQVLVCLLDNAVKYAADDGQVTLHTQWQEDVLIVSVCSTGQIDPKNLPHLFERFYKADTAHAEQGTGLGLSITWEVIELLGERIWAENCENEACFRFTLHGAPDTHIKKQN